MEIGRRRAVFLDRDGTLIDDTVFKSTPESVRLIPGVADALITLERLGFARIIVTNQSGIGRGYFTDAVYRATAAETERLLNELGATIDATWYCPHAPEAGCPCRKPATSLYREAIATFDLDPAQCWYMGDNARDVIPCVELGGHGILVLTGQGVKFEAEIRAAGLEVLADVPAGVDRISRYLDAL